jgi:hypothetical protein
LNLLYTFQDNEGNALAVQLQDQAKESTRSPSPSSQQQVKHLKKIGLLQDVTQSFLDCQDLCILKYLKEKRRMVSFLHSKDARHHKQEPGDERKGTGYYSSFTLLSIQAAHLEKDGILHCVIHSSAQAR